MTTRDSNRRATCGDFQRPEDELLATLLPFSPPPEPLPVAYAIPVTTTTPRTPSSDAEVRHSWHPSTQHQLEQQQQQQQRVVDAMVIPPPPNEDVYRECSGQRLSMAQEQGLQASHEEAIRISQNNRRVEEYNTRIELDLLRANEIARLENERERQLQNPTISSPPLPPPPPRTNGIQKRPSQRNAYFKPPPPGAGYQVKEYDLDQHECEYSYDINEHKIDYDRVE